MLMWVPWRVHAYTRARTPTHTYAHIFQIKIAGIVYIPSDKASFYNDYNINLEVFLPSCYNTI